MGWVKLSSLPDSEVRVEQYSKNRVYWKIEAGCVFHQRRKLRNADAETFEVRSDEWRFLGRDARAIYHAWSEVTQADRRTFEILGDNYFRDAVQGFFEFETSLRPLKGGPVGNVVNLGGGYARDAAC
ncbi:MAG: DKNYY domain-containing protein, partial [Planctomycetota bacterium]